MGNDPKSTLKPMIEASINLMDGLITTQEFATRLIIFVDDARKSEEESLMMTQIAVCFTGER